MGSVQKNGQPPDRDPRSRGQAPREARQNAPHALPTPDLIKCAECFKCKQFRSPVPGMRGRYFLKAKCSAGHWEAGTDGKAAHIHRVLTRSRHDCKDYETTSSSEEDRQEFLSSLKKNLPWEAHMYEPDGSFVHKVELLKWVEPAT